MYALATLPLINRLPKILVQVVCADDACACGSVTALCNIIGISTCVTLALVMAIM